MIKPGHIDPLTWYDVRIEVRDAEYRCFLDDVLLFRGRSHQFTSGRVGFATWDNTARFRDIEVTAPDGKTLWRGPPAPPAGQPSVATAPRVAADRLPAGTCPCSTARTSPGGPPGGSRGR